MLYGICRHDCPLESLCLRTENVCFPSLNVYSALVNVCSASVNIKGMMRLYRSRYGYVMIGIGVADLPTFYCRFLGREFMEKVQVEGNGEKGEGIEKLHFYEWLSMAE